MTTFGDTVFQYGGVPVGGGMLPLMGGSTSNGLSTAFFVDAANGSTGNSGLRPDKALVSVGAAYAKTVSGRGDTVYLMNDGTTSGSSRESTIPLVWANDNTHLVGLSAPSLVSNRARITPVTTAALLAAAVINVTGNGNQFRNVQIAHFGADTNGIAARGVDITGARNVFVNVHIVGIPNADTGDEAEAADLFINGGEENSFYNCAIGVDTVARSTSNASIDLQGAAKRNYFKDCVIAIETDAGTPLFVKADGSGDLDRWTLFKDCLFVNAMESGSTILTSAVNVHNTAGGMLVFQGGAIIGATNVAAADNGNVYVDGVGGAATGALSIIATQ